jgi:hypothetical protein
MKEKSYGIAGAILLALMLSACNSGASITCPPLKTHSADFWKEARAELGPALVVAPHLAILLKDYELTQDAIKVCMKSK